MTARAVRSLACEPRPKPRRFVPNSLPRPAKREPLAFMAINDEDVLDAGLPLEHGIYRAGHAHPCPLKKPDGWSIASVGDGDHPRNRRTHEKQLEDPADRLTPEPFALRVSAERKTDLRLLQIVGDANAHISDQLVIAAGCDAELAPVTWFQQ